jgi:hypothetical protein
MFDHIFVIDINTGGSGLARDGVLSDATYAID